MPPPSVKKALRLLGIDNFLLGIHDAALPSLAEEDIGRGSPYSRGAAEFFQFVRRLGFDGIQFGPQGMTAPDNPSPYDGTFFARNPLSLAPFGLMNSAMPLFRANEMNGLIETGAARQDQVNQDCAVRTSRRIAAEACRRYRRIRAEANDASVQRLDRDFAAFRRRNAEWLTWDALYEILQRHYGDNSWRNWRNGATADLDRQLPAPPVGREALAQRRMQDLRRQQAIAIEDFAFIQFLLAGQHTGLQAECRALGLKLFGDFQIGFSARDAWAAQGFLLPGYLLGAPPSRTNPSGQPWNYPLLDPRRYFFENGSEKILGPATRFLRRRVEKLLNEFDGLRIDHPHGLICPWAYRPDQGDPVSAVQAGARLFASPDLDDHPELREFAIVRPDQLNRQTERFADDWVGELEPEQVQRYASLFEVLMATLEEKKRGRDKVACEILSTQPYPVQKVMEHYGLGRFRVTQKANLDNPDDVYRAENSRPADWLMLGNHDTPSIWKVARGWIDTGQARQQAVYLAERLRLPEQKRCRWVDHAAADLGVLVQAKFADLLVGPARNVMVFFTDLLGMVETYNRPGSVNDDNWSLRVPADYPRIYSGRLRQSRVLNLPAALAMALRARSDRFGAEHADLITELEALAKTPPD